MRSGVRLNAVLYDKIPRKPIGCIWLSKVPVDKDKLSQSSCFQTFRIPTDDWVAIKAEGRQENDQPFL